jgi:hypothetical protein
MSNSLGWSEEDHVVLGGDDVQGSQVGDGVAVESAGVVEVELFQGFSRREAGGADAALPAVGLPCRDFALQAGHQVFFVAPVLGPSPIGEPGRRLADTLFVCPETRHCPRYMRKRPPEASPGGVFSRL